jgi:hypothetical protein
MTSLPSARAEHFMSPVLERELENLYRNGIIFGNQDLHTAHTVSSRSSTLHERKPNSLSMSARSEPAPVIEPPPASCSSRALAMRQTVSTEIRATAFECVPDSGHVGEQHLVRWRCGLQILT